MDIECVQVLKTLRSGKKTIQPGIYYAPLDRVLTDEVRAGGKNVVVVDAKHIAAVAAGTSSPVSAFKNEIKRLNAVCEKLKTENEALKKSAEEASDAFGALAVSFESLEVAYKELHTENESLINKNDLEIQENNVKKLLDEKANIAERQTMKKGGRK